MISFSCSRQAVFFCLKGAKKGTSPYYLLTSLIAKVYSFWNHRVNLSLDHIETTRGRREGVLIVYPKRGELWDDNNRIVFFLLKFCWNLIHHHHWKTKKSNFCWKTIGSYFIFENPSSTLFYYCKYREIDKIIVLKLLIHTFL